MTMKRLFPAGSFLLALCLVPALRATLDDDLFRPFSLVSGSEQLTAASSKVFNGYTRDRNPDGTFRTETYSFGNGGMVSAAAPGADAMAISAMGAPRGTSSVSDPTIDNLGFEAIASTIARPLAERNYIPARNGKGADILIMLYWGRSGGSYLETDGSYKDYIDAWNAQLMGFDTLRYIKERTDVSTVFLGRSLRSQMLDQIHSPEIAALEMDRYFVIMQAFDFQTAWKQKKIKLRWETRFSLSERQHDFSKELPTMAHTASIYFGQDTGGLIRARIPEGQVDVGQVKSLGTVPQN
jgi:hypothetical protein